jgi:bla regulator protein BlaR1
MNSRDLLSALGERLGWTVLQSLWQGAIIAVLLAIALLLLRRRSAAARHAACLMALLLLLAAACTTALRLSDRQPTKSVALSPSLANISPPAPLDPSPQRTVTVWSPLREVESPEPAAAVPNSPPQPKASWQDRVRPSLPWIAGGWLCGVVLLSMRHLGGWCRVRSWRRHGEEVDSATMSVFTQSWRRCSPVFCAR